MYLTGNRDADTKTDDLPLQLFFSLSSAICGCLNQLLVAIANKYENANKLAIASTTNLLWSFFFDAILFVNQQCSFLFINVFNISGALLILMAAVLNIILKSVEEKRKKKSPAG
jgi:hypothetical protein